MPKTPRPWSKKVMRKMLMVDEVRDPNKEALAQLEMVQLEAQYEAHILKVHFSEEQWAYLCNVALNTGQDSIPEIHRGLDLAMKAAPKWKPEGKCECYGEYSTCTGHVTGEEGHGGIYLSQRDGRDLWVCYASIVDMCYCESYGA